MNYDAFPHCSLRQHVALPSTEADGRYLATDLRQEDMTGMVPQGHVDGVPGHWVMTRAIT